MAASVRQLFANSNITTTQTVVLGASTTFVAMASLSMLDSLTDFDRDNAAVIDIPFVDGVSTNVQVFGGDHWGSNGNFNNVRDTALVRFGRTVTFRLRSIGPDLDAFGCGVVITNP